jgi:hypothetical protein
MARHKEVTSVVQHEFHLVTFYEDDMPSFYLRLSSYSLAKLCYNVQGCLADAELLELLNAGPLQG